jgi:flagellar biosynthesis component FlhA
LINRTVYVTVILVVFAFGLVFVSLNYTQSVLAQKSTAKNATQNASSATGTNATKGAVGSAQQLSQLGVGAGSQIIKIVQILVIPTLLKRLLRKRKSMPLHPKTGFHQTQLVRVRNKNNYR